MNAATIALFDASMQRVNAQERKQREDYYAYLKTRGEAEPTLEEHLKQFASFARTGEPASEAEIDALRKLSGPELPQALIAFYRKLGSFRGGSNLKDLVLHAPAALVAKSKRNPDSPWDHAASMGLVDMIRWSWGNDRFEFDPASGEGLQRPEVEALNSKYSVVGWRMVEEGEGFEYLYFDAAGGFGLLFYHQDAFDELYQDELRPMIEGRAAPDSFDAAIAKLLESSQGSDFDE